MGLTGALRREDIPPAAYAAEWRRVKEAQPFDTVEELRARGAPRQGELAAALGRAVERIEGGRVENPGLKKAERIAEKIRDKGYDSARQVTDAVRAGAVVARPEDGDAIVARLAEAFRVIDEGWATNANGYFDRKVGVIFPDGMIAEVQLWPSEVFAAKKKGSELYDAWRTEKDPAKAEALAEEQRAYWAAVAKELPESWSPLMGGRPNRSTSSAKSSTPSSSVSGRPSQTTSRPLTLSQPRFGESTQPSMLDGPTATASRSSQLNQDVSGAINEKIGSGDPARKPDPALAAEAEQALADAGGDLEIVLFDDSGAERRVSARQALREAEDDAAASAELADCIIRAEGTP